MLTFAVLVLLAAPALDLSSAPRDVEVEASYRPPARVGELGAVVVRFSPSRPELRVNAEPAPRLKLIGEGVLLDRQAKPVGAGGIDPEFANYLDPAQPFEFPVELDKAAKAGAHTVSATVSFAYCSKAQGWCKRGQAPIEFQIELR